MACGDQLRLIQLWLLALYPLKVPGRVHILKTFDKEQI
jgi:hypothetical protein